MKLVASMAIAVAIIGAGSSALAQGNVYTWTDARGNVHITDTPPPEQGRVQDVIQAPAPASGTPTPARTPGKPPEWARQAQAEAAVLRARDAETEAQEAVRRADEQSRYAIEYRKRFSNSPERRENFKFKIRAEEEKAEALRLEALKAVDRARAAAEDARAAVVPPPEKRP
jgi:hypothetical protein